jgi:hypothetical protein
MSADEADGSGGVGEDADNVGLTLVDVSERIGGRIGALCYFENVI